MSGHLESEYLERTDNQVPDNPARRRFLEKVVIVSKLLVFSTLGGVTLRAFGSIQEDRATVERYQAAQQHRSAIIEGAIEQVRTDPNQIQPLVLDPKSLQAIQAGETFAKQRGDVSLRFAAEQALLIAGAWLAWLGGLRATHLEENNQVSSQQTPPIEEKKRPKFTTLL